MGKNIDKNNDVFASVLHIGTSPDGRGGIATVIREYASYFGDSFHYICSHKDGVTRVGKIWLFLVAVLKTLYRCVGSEVKIVHIHSSSHVSFYRKSCFVLIARALGKIVVLHLHGGLFVDFAQEHRRYCQWIFDCTDMIVTVSDYLRTNVSTLLSHTRMTTIYNPITPVCPGQGPITDGNGKLQVLFLGTINENKGIMDILDCLEANLEYFRDKIHLHIGGVGPLALQIERRLESSLLRDFVTYYGWLEGERKIDLLRRADVYLQPSYFESLGISVLEAMSYRTAIIASRRGGLPEIVHHNENGFLIEPGNIQELFSALETLINDPVKRELFAYRGGQMVEQYYISNVMRQLLKEYTSLV